MMKFRHLDALALSILFSGCAPRYAMYPTLSMNARMTRCEKKPDDRFLIWKRQMHGTIAELNENAWHPSMDLLIKTYPQALEDFGSQAAPIDTTTLQDVQAVFLQNYELKKSSSDLSSVSREIHAMLTYIDGEHPALLVESWRMRLKRFWKGLWSWNPFSLPSTVSDSYPVGVSASAVTTPPSPSEDSEAAGSGMIIVANTVITSSASPVALTPEGRTLLGASSGKKSQEDKTAAEPAARAIDPAEADFQSPVPVTLSLSTVLNSPSVLDRIEYVSTYLYLVAYPYPPNGDLVLEREFWKAFLAHHCARDPLIQDPVALADMRQTLEEMRVRITSIDTAVNEHRSVDLGTLVRNTTDSWGATAAVTPGLAAKLAGLAPGLNYGGGVTTADTLKLEQDLDQRSTYVDKNGHFLRITQRGMQSVNLAGRVAENIQLAIPLAQDPFEALTPETTGPLTLWQAHWLHQPLYTRVDALVVSVVVARQTTDLKSSKADGYRLESPNDADFIVGVTRPERIPLWRNPRILDQIYASDIYTQDELQRAKAIDGDDEVYFAKTPDGLPQPLQLAGFTEDQEHALRDVLRSGIWHADEKTGLVLLPGGKNPIYAGLLDPGSKHKLSAFPKPQ